MDYIKRYKANKINLKKEIAEKDSFLKSIQWSKQ